MPDPWLYGRALVAAMLAGAGLSLVSRRVTLIRRSGRAAITARLLSIIAAAAVGLTFAGLSPNVPPRNALDRLLVLLIPVTLLVEWLITSHPFAPPVTADVSLVTRLRSPTRGRSSPSWSLWIRLLTALAAAPVLLYGSVYLQPGTDDWAPGRLFLGITLGAASLTGASELLGRLASRSVILYRATVTSIGATILVSGMLIMMAGYIKGGATAFPLAGIWLGLACVRPNPGHAIAVQPDVRLGVTCLFGLLFVGRFFGGLSSGVGVALFVAPLAGWVALVAVQAVANVVRRWRPNPATDAHLPNSSTGETSDERTGDTRSSEKHSPMLSRVTALFYALLVAALLGVLLNRGYAQFRQKLGKLAGSLIPERHVAELRVTRLALLGHSMEQSRQ